MENSNTNSLKSKNIYFKVYSYVAERGDYFQPRKQGDFLLPDEIISYIVTTILVTYFTGFIGKFGEDTADWLREKVANLKRKPNEIKNIETDELLKIMESSIDIIEGEDNEKAVEEIKNNITKHLELNLNLSSERAEEMASSLVEIIENNINK